MSYFCVYWTLTPCKKIDKIDQSNHHSWGEAVADKRMDGQRGKTKFIGPLADPGV